MPNKYQEALNYIVRNSCYKKTICSECNMHNNCHIPAKRDVDILQELVDKATPTKPALAEIYCDRKTDIYDENGWIDPDICCCPSCKKLAIYDFEYDEKYKHCTFCGQRIDWSDEDD